MWLALIGPRGCGKTTIGRILAARIGCDFVDLDALAAAQFEEPTIEAIWSAHGESKWRAAELRALHEALQSTPEAVIALGGGTPLIPEAHERLLNEKSRGLRIVYLQCSVAVLSRRLRQEQGDRPRLTAKGTIEEIADVLAAREPTYLKLADLTINAEAAPEAVATAISQSEFV